MAYPKEAAVFEVTRGEFAGLHIEGCGVVRDPLYGPCIWYWEGRCGWAGTWDVANVRPLTQAARDMLAMVQR